MLAIDRTGMVQDAQVMQARRLHIEHGPLAAIHGIIVHQTGGATARSSLDSYLRPGANGAHLLIIENLKARCLLESRCTHLTSTFHIRPTEIFRHPDVSWKTPTEAATARR